MDFTYGTTGELRVNIFKVKIPIWSKLKALHCSSDSLLELSLLHYFNASTQNGFAVKVPLGSNAPLIFCTFLYVTGS